MNVLVIGANGQIGRHLVSQLKENPGHTVRAMVRKQEQLEALDKSGIEAVLADLEGTVEELAEAMKGNDAVVFTAGSGGSTGADKTLLIDLDGAVKTMEAAEKAGISRYIMVSAIYAEDRTKWPDAIKPYYVAKHYADKWLENSSLNYTIIRPGGLKNEPGNGKVSLNPEAGESSIPREDVAAVIVAALDADNTCRKAFPLVSGRESINEVIEQI
ncbi:SDR family oxidoreductase [Paenibacillus urinalis]|uniref:SDR family oxidoreductase n=1 Tax=Paenibacillus urinalis TaxID=521520 RepID=A0AAX3N042_9BACL|nr:SDR family oxidoreductase [Paenibacillus urinalis]WDH82524.1 SDR family oxidoreductase [Paenibacillus urinalis]WDH98577.1 SDR family oxidoreductase [Paenibacillus urinalis]WDI02270.1 SDR family oxidoreductase [Paenibacillus urinalis]